VTDDSAGARRLAQRPYLITSLLEGAERRIMGQILDHNVDWQAGGNLGRGDEETGAVA
jgi:hypothetical protein